LYFFLYKYLKEALGVEQLGVWSLILSFSSIANLGNLGLTSGLVKFVADYIAEEKYLKIGRLILTAFLSLAVLYLLISCLVIWFADLLLPLVIKQEEFLPLALSILPFSLASFSINTLSGVFTSVLEGFQKNYLRNLVYIFSSVVMYIVALLLTPIFHLKGVAMAQVIQSFFIMLSSLVIMCRIHPFNRPRYWKWSSISFKELFNYGYKFQAVSIFQLLYEPTTKILLSRFAGMSLLGYYEYASRLVNQFRALLVSANQVVIPVVAESCKNQV
jgi:O-antigen/teichoic acid export membrane protein